MANVNWSYVGEKSLVYIIVFSILGALTFAVLMAVWRPTNPKEAEQPAIVTFGVAGGFIVIGFIIIFFGVLGGDFSVIKKFNK